MTSYQENHPQANLPQWLAAEPWGSLRAAVMLGMARLHKLTVADRARDARPRDSRHVSPKIVYGTALSQRPPRRNEYGETSTNPRPCGPPERPQRQQP